MSRLEEVLWWVAGAACLVMFLFPPWHRTLQMPSGEVREFCYNWILWDQSSTHGSEPFFIHFGLLVIQWTVALATPALIGMLGQRIQTQTEKQKRPGRR